MKKYFFIIEEKNNNLIRVSNSPVYKNEKSGKIPYIVRKKVKDDKIFLTLVSKYLHDFIIKNKDEPLNKFKIIKIIEFFPEYVGKWIFEYKEIYEEVKENILFLSKNSKTPVKINENRIDKILDIKHSSKNITIESKISKVNIYINCSSSEFYKKITANEVDIFYIMASLVGTQAVAPVFETDYYIIDDKFNKVLKKDPEMDKICKYFDFFSYTISKGNSNRGIKTNFEKLLKLLKDYSNASSKINIVVSTISGSVKLEYVRIENLFTLDNKGLLMKIIEAFGDDKDFATYYGNYIFFDKKEVKLYEEKIIDFLTDKDVKKFNEKLKEIEVCKTKHIKKVSEKDQEKFNEEMKKKGLNATLYEHQVQSVGWLNCLYDSGMTGAILADDMGLGKTITTISFLNSACYKSKKKIIIIAPASVTGVWENEIEKFAPNLKKKNKINIFSYEMFLRSNINDCDILVLDEAQKIKNNSSVSFKKISSTKRDFSLIVTGTPVENKINDLFSLLHIIDEASFQIFALLKKVYNDDNILARKIKLIIDPIYLQRKKEDVKNIKISGKLNIIEDIINPTQIELELQKNIKDFFSDVMIKLEATNNHDFYAAQQMLLGFMRMRQALSYPAQLPDELIEHFPKKLQSAIKTLIPSKFKRVKEIYKEINKRNEKLVIFTQFTGTLNYIYKELQKEGAKCLKLSGADSSSKRNLMVKEFQEKNTYDVFIISLKAGNSGLTLTSANHVIIYDLWFNPQVIAQAIARVYRIGQEKEVNAYFNILDKTIDKNIFDIIYKKKNLIEAFEKGKIESNSKNDIIELGDKIFHNVAIKSIKNIKLQEENTIIDIN